MAELIGKHCSYPLCNQLDFLPIFCQHCQQIYCKNHGSSNDHNCSILNQNDNKIDVLQSSSAPSLLICSFELCNEKCPIEFLCPKCKKNYCIKHRHFDDHKCAFQEQRQLSSSPLPSKTTAKVNTEFHSEKFQGTKNETLANKVALMKLKQTAKGPQGVPLEARLHVFIEFNTKRYPFFFSKLWPLGRALDYLLNELKLTHTTTKYALFKIDIHLDLSTCINELENKSIINDADILVLKNVS
ncbi:unnamed protein product [Didymodactylos carnosus]|uniref:AN1-type domain-containing protein n=1 Tax=Didymodactylos carnosus TaxID=1234261 RepID=A0A8S2FW20_9BILA|nr:unnamed protein product [Didymodactylos carnosus]CAF4362054.1 unnamed protein product [Didymodactylos carnosus]